MDGRLLQAEPGLYPDASPLILAYGAAGALMRWELGALRGGGGEVPIFGAGSAEEASPFLTNFKEEMLSHDGKFPRTILFFPFNPGYS
jgi:hypothetical protein